ncbi:hypothetical protein [Sphingomonas sp. 2378]|uniref:hypothetical protein n=1 Tax=Sphingomonas sp. 2378 TaxID=1219748 RepID=UPI00311B297F
MAIRRDQWVFGLAGFAIAGLFGGAVTMLLYLGLKSDDVFAFSGALIGALVGAVGTVLGAAWLADRAINQERQVEQKDIVEEVEHVLFASSEALKYFEADGSYAPGWHKKMSEFQKEMGIAKDYFKEVIGHAKTINFRQRREIKILVSSIGYFLDLYNEVMVQEYEDDPYDDRTFEGLIRHTLHQAALTTASFGDRPTFVMGLGRSRI